MKHHGVLIETYKSSGAQDSSLTARPRATTSRAMSPKGARFWAEGDHALRGAITAFIKLKDIKGNVLPPYEESFALCTDGRASATGLQPLVADLDQCAQGGLALWRSFLIGRGAQLPAGWPDTAFREENVMHPRHRRLLAYVPALWETQT